MASPAISHNLQANQAVLTAAAAPATPPSPPSEAASANRPAPRAFSPRGRIMSARLQAALMHRLDDPLAAPLTQAQERKLHALLRELEHPGTHGPGALLRQGVNFLFGLPLSFHKLHERQHQRLLDMPGMGSELRLLEQQSPPHAATRRDAQEAAAGATHTGTQTQATPAQPGLIERQMDQLKALEQELAALHSGPEDMNSPTAKARAAQIEMRMTALTESIFSTMKMLADLHQRATQIAIGAI
jgi:hypothetical protein